MLNNHRVISLLGIADKVFCTCNPSSITQIGRKSPESQCGYRSQRSTTDIIFCVWQLQEKCKKQNVPLYIVFIYLTKVFDLISREGLLLILFKISLPLRLISILMFFHTNTKATVQYDGKVSDLFTIKNRLNEGCAIFHLFSGFSFLCYWIALSNH